MDCVVCRSIGCQTCLQFEFSVHDFRYRAVHHVTGGRRQRTCTEQNATACRCVAKNALCLQSATAIGQRDEEVLLCSPLQCIWTLGADLGSQTRASTTSSATLSNVMTLLRAGGRSISGYAVMRALQAAAAVCLTLALLAVSSDGAVGRSLLASNKGVDMPRLTNNTLLTHLQAVATPHNELVFTTTSAWTPAILDMLKNFVYHMHAVGRDGNLMVISQDNGTCAALLVRAWRLLPQHMCPAATPAVSADWAAVDPAEWDSRCRFNSRWIRPCVYHVQELNVPCYLDELSPRSWEFPEGHRYGERPWDFGKIWWSLRLAQLGYASLYLDNDVAAVKDPLAIDIVQSPYDLQVRWRLRWQPKSETPAAHVSCSWRCGRRFRIAWWLNAIPICMPGPQRFPG